MRIDIVTLFPDMFTGVFGESILKRAQESDVIDIHFWNPRDFSLDKHKRVDDVPYGGGRGMLLNCQPLFDCFDAVKAVNTGKVYFFSAGGTVWDQTHAQRLAENAHDMILLCGHYEGIDQRVIDTYVDAEISLGHFILTGGEIPAMAIVDSLVRLLPGAIEEDSHLFESFSDAFQGKIEHPHYTRPEEFRGQKVPEVLLSGHHKKIEEWRMENLR